MYTSFPDSRRQQQSTYQKDSSLARSSRDARLSADRNCRHKHRVSNFVLFSPSWKSKLVRITRKTTPSRDGEQIYSGEQVIVQVRLQYQSNHPQSPESKTFRPETVALHCRLEQIS